MKKMLNSFINLSKTTVAIPLFMLVLNSCNNRNEETGIVVAKNSTSVYLAPVDRPDSVCRKIWWFHEDKDSYILGKNINVGDKISFINPENEVVFRMNERYKGKFVCVIGSVNGKSASKIVEEHKKREKEAEEQRLIEKKKKEDARLIGFIQEEANSLNR